jgi:hypothetical protein
MQKLFLYFFLIYATNALASDLPDPAITPGAINPNVTQTNIQSTICAKSYKKPALTPVSFRNNLKLKQIKAYGYTDQNLNHYDEDYLVPIILGGNPMDPHNLWPQALKGQWNAEKKDRLELEIYSLVCLNVIPLEEAQSLFITDWTAAYKRYVNENDAHKKKVSHVD